MTSKEYEDALRYMDRIVKKALKSKKAARALLIKAGILTKDGKRLNARYR
jgi:hypothetical protein